MYIPWVTLTKSKSFLPTNNKPPSSGSGSPQSIMYQLENSLSPQSQYNVNGNGNGWSRLEDKLFEQALVLYPDHLPDRWQRIAADLPGKSPSQVRDHYDALVHDVSEIDSGRVQLPAYTNSHVSPDSDRLQRQSDADRKKGTPWTEDEHKLFLIGLKRYGKGDWRSISRNVVVTRTPTQVASHAQKYFLRQNSVKKDRKRSSIHDITTADGNTS